MKHSRKMRRLESRQRDYDEVMVPYIRKAKLDPEAFRRPGSLKK